MIDDAVAEDKMGNNIADLCKKNEININSIDVIAFDVFDTVLFRKVSPIHVHRIWANEIIKKYSLKISAEQLVKRKFAMARVAKIYNLVRGKDKEYTYRQMINLLYRYLQIKEKKETFYRECLQLEIEIEKSVCFVSGGAKELVESAQKEKRVICISDFYLPAIAVQEILNSKGIHVEKIYVSCDFLLQKRSGRIYARVTKDMKISSENVLMIGDNRKSDCENAIQNGMKAIWNDNRVQHEQYRIFEDKLNDARKEYLEYMKSDVIKKRTEAFSNVAFLMYIFINRLYQKLHEDGCEHVLFMSREGEFFKRLFDLYQDKFILKREQICTHYFYVSRRATILPSIHEISKKSFKEIYKNYPQMSIYDFLKNLGLEKNKELLSEISKVYELMEVVSDFANSREYDFILNNEMFQRVCLEEAKQQRQFFIKYLDDMNISYRNKGLYLVDVGYSGTSQNNIEAIYERGISVHGYYMISYAKENSNYSKKGIIYDILSGEKKDVLTYNSAVIEMLCLASHGSVEGYKLERGECVPVFNYNEQEKKCFDNVISKLQNTIADEFEKIAHLVDKAYLDENYYYKDFRKQYKRFIYNPTVKEMEEYLTIPFVDNFAIYREYIPERKKKNYKLFSFKGLKRIIETKGKCIKEQNTHWIAAALYKLDMGGLNKIMYLCSGVMIFIFDCMVRYFAKKRGVKYEK